MKISKNCFEKRKCKGVSLTILMVGTKILSLIQLFRKGTLNRVQSDSASINFLRPSILLLVPILKTVDLVDAGFEFD